MHDFMKNSSAFRNDFVAICNLLKAYSNGKYASTLTEEGDTQWIPELSRQTLAFLKYVNSLSQDEFDWSKFSMNPVGVICYALKACLEIKRGKDFFSDEQLILLKPILRGITRKLIDHLDQNKLMKPSHQSYGDVLAVLAWLTKGFQLYIPTASGQKTKLLSGAAPGKVGIDAIYKQALNYFSDLPFKAMDTRQLGKLFFSLGRVISHKLLDLNQGVDQGQTLGKRLTEKLLELCAGNALISYTEWGEDNFRRPLLKDKTRHINPVAVENLADGLQACLTYLFDTSDARVGLVVNRMAGLIQKAVQSGNAQESTLKVYAKFLNTARLEQYNGTDSKKIDEVILLVNTYLSGNSTNS